MANLNSTVLAAAIGSSDTIVPLSSLSGITKGDVIYILDQGANVGEAMPTNLLITTSNPVAVRVTRSANAGAHGAGATVYTGPPSAFYTVDPKGSPPAGQQPYWINVKTGAIWVAQGDEVGPGASSRYWQLQVSTPSKGALGARTVAVAPTQTV